MGIARSGPAFDVCPNFTQNPNIVLTMLFEALTCDPVTSQKSIPCQRFILIDDLLGVAPDLSLGSRTFKYLVDGIAVRSSVSLVARARLVDWSHIHSNCRGSQFTTFDFSPPELINNSAFFITPVMNLRMTRQSRFSRGASTLKAGAAPFNRSYRLHWYLCMTANRHLVHPFRAQIFLQIVECANTSSTCGDKHQFVADAQHRTGSFGLQPNPHGFCKPRTMQLMARGRRSRSKCTSSTQSAN